MTSTWILTILLVCSSPAFASMIPPHRAASELNERLANGMDRATFDAVLDQIEDVYRDTFESMGAYLSLERLWNSSKIDAHAVQEGDTWIIRVYGGLARHPSVTPDGLALVVCHEIGHHLAGFPQASSWAAAEGAADYYATQTCLKKIWARDSKLINADGEADQADELCQGPQKWGKAFCVRALRASYSLASFLADLESTTVSWDEPDRSEVAITNLSYPSVQCRFDTLISGTFCERPSSHKLIPWNEKEMAASSCHQTQNDSKGLRPRCWFRSRL